MHAQGALPTALAPTHTLCEQHCMLARRRKTLLGRRSQWGSVAEGGGVIRSAIFR